MPQAVGSTFCSLDLSPVKPRDSLPSRSAFQLKQNGRDRSRHVPKTDLSSNTLVEEYLGLHFSVNPTLAWTLRAYRNPCLVLGF